MTMTLAEARTQALRCQSEEDAAANAYREARQDSLAAWKKVYRIANAERRKLGLPATTTINDLIAMAQKKETEHR